MALRCFDHAFALADDNATADVWYNIGQVAVGKATPCACGPVFMAMHLISNANVRTVLSGSLAHDSVQLAVLTIMSCPYFIFCKTAGIGDVNMAYQAFTTASAVNSTHAEALTNLGVLEVQQGNDAAALRRFQAAQKMAPHAYEAWYNGALVSMRAGNLQECYSQATSALDAFPDHSDTKDLLKQLQSQFNAL